MSSDYDLPPEGSRPSLPPPRPDPPRMTQAKNPLVALFLSFLIPGIGQGYNGQAAKAFVFFLSFAASLYAVIQIDPLPYAFLLPFIYFYGLVDAYRSADLLNARAQGGLPSLDEEQESPAWGATLVLLGLVFLASNLGWLSLYSLHRFWPIILIVFGVLFMRKSLQGGRGSGHGTPD
jgi:TM2 domain-containing membrane protein YozV